jgi:hypothetical protein
VTAYSFGFDQTGRASAFSIACRLPTAFALGGGASKSGSAYSTFTAQLMFCGRVPVRATKVSMAAVETTMPTTSPCSFTMGPPESRVSWLYRNCRLHENRFSLQPRERADRAIGVFRRRAK